MVLFFRRCKRSFSFSKQNESCEPYEWFDINIFHYVGDTDPDFHGLIHLTVFHTKLKRKEVSEVVLKSIAVYFRDTGLTGHTIMSWEMDVLFLN